MLVTRQPVFRRFWHAAMPLSLLESGPRPFTLLGENIVLFLDAEGEPAALKDRCCHRTAQLSKGWCPKDGALRGTLQCGYHGWTYDRSGRVVHIPQYGAERAIPADYRTPAYRCKARYGYAWVALEEPIAEIPEMPEFGAAGWRTIFQFHEEWATSPMRALENSFDNSHFSFVHRATFGVAAQPAPSKYEIVENETGFCAETIVAAANPEKFRRISGVAEQVTTRHMRNAYYLPFSRRLDIEYPSADGTTPGKRHVIINCFTPIDDGRMQLCQWLFRNDSEADCPAQLLIDFDAEITREDKEILESTDPDAVVDPRRRGVEYSMDSDRPGILIRKRLFELLRRHGEEEVHRGNLAAASIQPAPAEGGSAGGGGSGVAGGASSTQTFIATVSSTP